MSRRQSLLALTQSRTSSCHSRSSPAPGQTAISARNSAMSSGARSAWCSSISRSSSTASHSSCRSNPGQPAPEHQLGARRDRAGRLELEQRHLADHLDQVGRPLLRQQLRPHRDPARIGAAELVDCDHAGSVEAAADDRRGSDVEGQPERDGVRDVDPLGLPDQVLQRHDVAAVLGPQRRGPRRRADLGLDRRRSPSRSSPRRPSPAGPRSRSRARSRSGTAPARARTTPHR